MLTVDVSALSTEGPNPVFALEFDTEHGTVQTLGETEVHYTPNSYLGMDRLESATTGGCYSEPQESGGIELWNVEEHYLAVFPDEASIRRFQRARSGVGQLEDGDAGLVVVPELAFAGSVAFWQLGPNARRLLSFGDEKVRAQSQFRAPWARLTHTVRVR